MITSYRGGALPAASGPVEDIDRQLIDHTARLPDAVRHAYERLELQQAATLPIELARATNGYIDATQPFKLAKDPAQSARLDTVLHHSAQAIKTALVALLPILPAKAAGGLQQLNAERNNAPLPPSHRLGEGKPLFPKLEMKAS